MSSISLHTGYLCTLTLSVLLKNGEIHQKYILLDDFKKARCIFLPSCLSKENIAFSITSSEANWYNTDPQLGHTHLKIKNICKLYFISKVFNYIIYLICFQSEPTSMLYHFICSTEILKLYNNKILAYIEVSFSNLSASMFNTFLREKWLFSWHTCAQLVNQYHNLHVTTLEHCWIFFNLLHCKWNFIISNITKFSYTWTFTEQLNWGRNVIKTDYIFHILVLAIITPYQKL